MYVCMYVCIKIMTPSYLRKNQLHMHSTFKYIMTFCIILMFRACRGEKEPLGIALLRAMFVRGEGLLLSLAPYQRQSQVMPKHQVHHRVSGLTLNVRYIILN